MSKRPFPLVLKTASYLNNIWYKFPCGAVSFCVMCFTLLQCYLAIFFSFFVLFVFVFLHFCDCFGVAFWRFLGDSTSLFLLFITVLIVRYMQSGFFALLLTMHYFYCFLKV